MTMNHINSKMQVGRKYSCQQDTMFLALQEETEKQANIWHTWEQENSKVGNRYLLFKTWQLDLRAAAAAESISPNVLRG